MENLGIIITGSTPPTSKKEYYSCDGMLWVTPTDICENVTYETARKLSKKGQNVARLVPENTILVTCIASIGKNTLLGKMGSFNQQINGLIPYLDKYDPYYLFSESFAWSNKMKQSAGGLTFQIVNKTEFSKITTYIAPQKAEQEKIGTLFSNLDNLITLHQREQN